MSKNSVVAVSGNLGVQSRTRVLAQSLLDAVGSQQPAEIQLIQLADLGPQIGTVTSREQLPASAEAALRAIEDSDILIVVSPVYRASYTGLFKHLFDLVGQDALVDRPVILGATGGSDRHALVIEHQLRPLLSFFRAHTVPVGVYATEAHFTGYTLTDPIVQQRVNDAADQAVRLLGVQTAATPGLQATA